MDRSNLAERYARVKAGIPHGVTLVAVSKKRTAKEIQALYDLGHREFGENYAQELRAKQPVLPADIRWHFIGHLQRSNAKYIVPIAHLIHGVDGAVLLDEIDKRAAARGEAAEVLLQIHIAREETKHGLSPDEARIVAVEIAAGRWPSVHIRGLMGMATNTQDQAQVKAEFLGLANLHRELKQRLGTEFDILSMGMSSDLESALASGSNLVRVGTAIFGERS